MNNKLFECALGFHEYTEEWYVHSHTFAWKDILHICPNCRKVARKSSTAIIYDYVIIEETNDFIKIKRKDNGDRAKIGLCKKIFKIKA